MAYLLHQLLAESVARFPDRIAARCKQEAISYRALDELSGRLAAAMVARGLLPGDRVGILLPKSIESVVGIFAALKAGGVYVPIDPLMPSARARYIVDNCGIRHVVTSSRKSHEVFAEESDGPRRTYYHMDAGAPTPALSQSMVVDRQRIEAAEPLSSFADRKDSDLAYILYTSGSTGAPKGVMISHRAALTFVDWAHAEFAVAEEDVLANVAPLHFDLSVFDLYAAIKAGAMVVLVPPEYSTFPVMLTRLINEHRITVWYSVPSALTMMLTKGGLEKHEYPSLRVILFAGEVFPIKYFQQLRRVTSARLCNLYGPTETNVCTFFDATHIADDFAAPLPIGKAIAGYRIFLLDESGRPANPGEEGELCAGGPGLMSGYWGDAEKTGRQLIASPDPLDAGQKLYRTGDIVRQDESGNYIYISRRDNMVKSRGYRIELGEIEAALYAHPDVREAAVIAIPDDLVTNRLEAYVAAEGGALVQDDLLRHCLERVPKYMVPEVIHFRSELPKTSTGKIDKRALS